MRTILIILLILTSIACKKEQEESLVQVDIPSAFTPNGDDVNDRYYIHVRGNTDQYLKSFDLHIYSGNSTEVFSTASYDYDSRYWDGTYKNQPMPLGSYRFSLKYTDIEDHTVYKSGSFMLIR